MQDREGEDEKTGLFFVLSCSRIASRIDVSAFDRDRGSSPCYWALEAAASPHKDRTRWNNAIFAEEEEPMETKRRIATPGKK